MKIYTLQNEDLEIEISTKGAELQKLFSKKNRLEYLWCGDERFWGKKSPVLFPVVGGLKNNEFNYKNKNYQLNRHGFARDSEFIIDETTENSIQFKLTSSSATQLNFPFDFIFFIKYSIDKNILTCKYLVKNMSEETMFFSVGAHPAFKIPLTTNSIFSDWHLEFNKKENSGIFPLTEDGLLKEASIPFFKNNSTISLSKELFYRDALVFKDLKSTEVLLKNNQSIHGLKMQFKGFPYFGIWSAKNADFVCLEPWCGIADSVSSNGILSEKEGIIALNSNKEFSVSWSIELF